MATLAVGRGQESHRHRYQDRRIRLADRNASVPTTRERLVGGSLGYIARMHRPRDLLCRRRQMILLNGFIKKTQQTPQGELEKAVRRMKELES